VIDKIEGEYQIIMSKTLQNIKQNLYEIETIVSTDIIVQLLKKYHIDTANLKKIISLYQQEFHFLEKYEDDIIVKILDKKLEYFVKNTIDETKISLYHTQILIAMTFIEDKAKDILELKNQNIEKAYQANINYINSLEIENFYSIKKLELNSLQDKKEIYIVGENGDGKTLFLQSLVIALKGVTEGDIFNITKLQKEMHTKVFFDNDIRFFIEDGEYQNLFAYGSNRNNSCKMEVDKIGYLTLFNSSLDLNNPINWLINLYNATKDNQKLTINLEKAKEIIQKLLNCDIEIEVSYDRVEFQEKGTVVSFEQLSAGYKSVIIIICDMLKRLSKNQTDIKNIADFKGIVLIDEVELHLHPKWKYEFITTLRNIFPNIQFIVTTHSPTVILGASKEAVFYKIYKENTEVKISQQIANKGYTNNTIISSPLFDLGTMASRDFDNSKFTSDDFIYEKIHKIVAKKISTQNIMDDREIIKLIEAEMAKYDKS